MLQFKQSDTTAALILTLNENVTITDPYFLFVFTHVNTKQKVKFIKYIGADESNYTRYNKFTINPSVTFLDAPVGEYHYKVYEKAGSGGGIGDHGDPDFPTVDLNETGNIIEQGKLFLDRATDFSFTQYNEPQTFIAYNG